MSASLYDELDAVAARFGADLEQVRRDHLLSHVLAAISAGISTDDVVFFGGTALSRTYLADARLSEDTDLIALVPRLQLAGAIESAVARGIARSHGRVSWLPPLTATSGRASAGDAVGRGPGRHPGPAARRRRVHLAHRGRDIEQRYRDAPPARLRTLTAPAFAAAKLAAWMDRRAPRDLYDQWAMSERGLIDGAALDVFVRHGPTGKPPASWVFSSGPDDTTWRGALGHQTRLTVTAGEALAAVGLPGPRRVRVVARRRRGVDAHDGTMFVGVDTHEDTLAVAVCDPAGALVEWAELVNEPAGCTQLERLLETRSVVRVGIEGSGHVGRAVAADLVGVDYDVRQVPTSMTSPERSAGPGQGKTDAVDAWRSHGSPPATPNRAHHMHRCARLRPCHRSTGTND